MKRVEKVKQIFAIQKAGKREKKNLKKFEETIAQNFPKLMKKIKPLFKQFQNSSSGGKDVDMDLTVKLLKKNKIK